MPKKKHKGLHKGHREFILLALVLAPSPLTKQELRQKFGRVGYHVGIPIRLTSRINEDQHLDREMDADLNYLLSQGFITVEKNGAYRLTEAGAAEGREMDQGVAKVTRGFNTFISSPETASKISVLVNAMLAVLKLVVGSIFNSMALVADGFDSLVDVVSAVVVFLGIRHRREFYSTSFILVMMFGTAGFIAYEATSRLISMEPVDAAALAIAAAVVSGGVGYVMSVYQHQVGKRSCSLSLISQSIDSRNHTFQAAAVLTGLIFAIFGMFIVDSIVALLVAGLILKSAIGLTTEAIRMARGEELEISRFGREYERVVENRRRNYFKTWTLLTLKDVSSRADIISRYEGIFATDDLPVVGHFSPVGGFDFPGQIDYLLKELVDMRQVTTKGDQYYLTDKGRRALNRKLARGRFVFS